ncbi:class I SAM-dependent methyltransferase [Nocardia tengchongensis]|uniref:class I SAM-dependent methyltransferase n=1 Tax=Nocardia tengchongensis TaxID=2055889 RepID=UPI0036A35718
MTDPTAADTSAAIDANRALWDEWARIHAAGDWYDLEAVRAGHDKLRAYEIAEVGDVAGLRLLHLQCQIGTDSIAWARRGAEVTGVDLSPAACEIATDLAAQTGVDARFVCADVMALPEHLHGMWDIVYASRGVLGWLPDLYPWARIVAGFLASGGFFYLTDIHPIAKTLDPEATEFRAGVRPYWPRPAPIHHTVHGTYADPDAATTATDKYLWSHSVGELLTAVAEAGLVLEFFHEQPWADRPWPSLTAGGGPEREYFPPEGLELPLNFSLRARKP